MDPTFGAALLSLSVLATHPPETRTSGNSVVTPPAERLTTLIRDDANRMAPLLSRARDRPQDSRAAERRNWIQRHPSCFGAAVGFVGGFLIGFLPGDDAVFDDFTASFNGGVLGGVGAGSGAALGWFGSRK